MFTITDKAIDSDLIQKLHNTNLFVRECTSNIRDAREGCYYYEINNGHCACDIAVSPYDKVEEIKELIKCLNEGGDYSFVIIDSEYDDEYLEFNENKMFENTLRGLESIDMTGDNLLSIYPKEIKFDVMYKIMNITN
jgi:excinuclease UvrABC nuclease subunit